MTAVIDDVHQVVSARVRVRTCVRLGVRSGLRVRCISFKLGVRIRVEIELGLGPRNPSRKLIMRTLKYCCADESSHRFHKRMPLA